jgi:RNA polymerase-binding transcription factor DksA
VGGDEDEQPLNEMLQAIASDRNRASGDALGRAQRALEKLDRAPDEAGSCEECGEDIPWGRLKAMPYAELCVACQGKRDGHAWAHPTRRDGLPMTDRTELIRRADAWSAADPDETTRAELQRLVAAGTSPSWRIASRGTLEFGTAGLRGVVGAGQTG